jgi:plasmid stability protein
MSLDLRPVQVRLPEDAYEALNMLAKANGHDLGEEAREILTEALLGKSHCIRLLAARLSRAVGSDKAPESKP